MFCDLKDAWAYKKDGDGLLKRACRKKSFNKESKFRLDTREKILCFEGSEAVE